MTTAPADVGAWARRVLAPNPGPMTLEGTNTWLLAAPHTRGCVVVDPGPDDEQHLRAILTDVGDAGQQVQRILLTHGHPDHAEGAAHLAALTKAPVQALDPRHRVGSQGLAPGDELVVDSLRVLVVSAPGHTSDSVAFLLPDAGALLTGDTVLGAGWTVVAFPDGQLGEYLHTLSRLRDVVHGQHVSQILPGHGPVVTDPAERIDAYLEHRSQRLAQVRAAVASGATTADQVVATVYADVPVALWPAAKLSVQAQLAYLRQPGSG